MEIWQQIAARYKGHPALYAYELLNEPVQTYSGCKLLYNHIEAQSMAARAIRSIDPNTTLVFASDQWNAPSPFFSATINEFDNIIYSLHYYQVMEYSHQGVPGFGFNTSYSYPGIIGQWPSYSKAQMKQTLQNVRNFQLAHKVRIFVGEFSAVRWAGGADKWLQDAIDIFEEYGWDWAYHAWCNYHTNKNVTTVWSLEAENGTFGNSNTKISATPTKRKKVVLNAFSLNSTPAAPTLSADDLGNTLSASHPLGDSVILVSENEGSYLPYTRTIKVNNVARVAGYWKFKVKAVYPRTEGAVAVSPAFTFTTTPAAPTLSADELGNTLSAYHPLGDSVILVCENGGPYLPYIGTIKVNNIARAASYWKFKVKAAPGRAESVVVASPAFTVAITPDPPTLLADDVDNTLTATHPLGDSVILVCENGGPYLPYGGPITVGNAKRPPGYWAFKIKAAPQRNESAVEKSPEFTDYKLLPIRIKTINAYRKGDGIRVDWVVKTEISVKQYEVERSINATNFVKIGTVQGLGKSTISNEYSFFDKNAPTGASYYRVATIDNNGTKEMGSIASVSIDDEKESINIFPNPIIGNTINLRLNLRKGRYTVNLSSKTGELLLSTVIQSTGGATTKVLELKSLAKGSYQLQITDGKTTVTKQIIKNG